MTQAAFSHHQTPGHHHLDPVGITWGCGGEESRFFQTKRSFPDSLGQKCLVPDLLSTTTIHSSRHLVFNAALHSAQIKTHLRSKPL